ncbi:Quinone oxidoreductase-like protein 1 [Hondaea fermentalgiana]|uniref:Quinone oxidoreductase-like protein 1 n=1 Tax=Hondaea fermentalgiana TaxID=2315210 RepID=A0A2R5GB53_9STRA|nr:Quinone oxidoreductase-like protein 1 [Hondaea fermentalgiana]|eukprot:GBG27815.1 Quinone oxidoreductase-like protein 1 [Hondaea fermentalgiana]
MRAVVYTEKGGPEVLKLQNDFPAPTRAKGEILVKVISSAVNPVDWKLRKSFIPFFPNPKVVGCDVCGVVAEADSGSRFNKGDRVFFMLPIVATQGGCAEYVTVREGHADFAPRNLDDDQAAGLPLVGQTVLQGYEAVGITEKLRGQNKSILIHAGAGGVGSVAIQVAKYYGLYVYTTCSASNFDFVKSIGADRPIDYKTEAFEEVAVNVDYIFDLMGGDYELRGMKCINPSGYYINVMNSGWATKIASALDMPDGVTGAENTLGNLIGYAYAAYRKLAAPVTGPYYYYNVVQPRADSLKLLAKLADEGAVKPITDSVYSLEDTAEAHRRIEGGHARGKVVIRVAQSTSSSSL